MEVASSNATSSGAEAAAARRPLETPQRRHAPVSHEPPEPKSRGEAVVYGGSLANLDSGTASRDAARQSKIDRREDQELRSAERRDASRQRRAEQREVDVTV